MTSGRSRMQTQCPNAIPWHGLRIVGHMPRSRLSKGRFRLLAGVLPSTVAAVELFPQDQNEASAAQLRKRLRLAGPSFREDATAACRWARWHRRSLFGVVRRGRGCLLVLVIASQLTPSPAGYGSHTGYPLRLQSCVFMDRTGLPCPSCGMTTSFCWFVRGNVAASVYVQPMGAVLAAMACAASGADSTWRRRAGPSTDSWAWSPGGTIPFPC